MKRLSKCIFPVLILALIASLVLNFYQWTQHGEEASPKSEEKIIIFKDANSRDNYFTVHNVKAAHYLGTGKSIKVGIMDWLFGYSANTDLYRDAINFSQHEDALDSEGHGLWLANTLKEIAPDCDIYALSTNDGDENKRVDNMVRAIDWSIQNNIDILTYSNMAITEKNRSKIDEAVNRAVENGIVITFIHYDNPNNLFPNGFFEFSEGNREADINILHYDYNTMFQSRYDKFMSFKGDYSQILSGDDIPYLSISSTSIVLAGFVAILKSINPNLSPAQYKDILIKTSSSTEYYDWGFGRSSNIPHAVNIGKAAIFLKENIDYRK